MRAAVRRKLAQYSGAALAIHCYDIESVIYRDLLDLLLRGSGVRDWIWIDNRGRTADGGPLLRAMHRLAREALWRAPTAYLSHSRHIRGLVRQPTDVYAAALQRVLFVRSDHWFGVTAGGSVGHLAGVVNGFRKEGLHVEVTSTDFLPGIPVDEQFHLEPPQYGWIRNIPEFPRLEYNRQLASALASLWPKVRPDFIYHRYSQHNYVGPELRRRYRVPYVCEYNGSFIWMNRNWGKPLLFERLAGDIELTNLRAADLVVVVSRAMADEVIQRGILAEKVLVNPNGVDPDQYHPDISGDEVRRAYELEDKLVVGFIGTFGAWHGAENLVEAAARVRALRPGSRQRIHFLLIGDGERMGRVRTLVADNSLDEMVTLTGKIPQERGAAHLAACDILVSPHVPNPDGTPFFGSPTKIFEYMAMGRAIVASDLDQISEVLHHGETGWMVRPGDSGAVAEGILRLVEDPDLRARLGSNARRAAETRHSWRAHTRRILEALHERLRKPPATAAIA